MAPVIQMELDIGYLVKAAPLAPAVGIDKLPPPLNRLAAVVYDQLGAAQASLIEAV